MAGSMVQAQQQQAYTNAVNQANNDAFDMSRQARQREIERQATYEDEAQGHWTDALNSLTGDQYNEDATAAEDRFMTDYAGLTPGLQEGAFLSGMENASGDLKTIVSAQANKASKAAQDRIRALAKLTSYGNVDQTRGQALGNSADLLGTLNTIRRGSLAVAQQEQDIRPATVTQGSSFMGDILSGVGGIASGFAGRASAGAPLLG
jgi:hypothetical protein